MNAPETFSKPAATVAGRSLWPIGVPVLLAGIFLLSLRLFSSQPLSALIMGIPQLLTIDPTPVFHCQAKQGQTVTAEFSVRNVTDTPVRILGATAACTCAKVSTDLPIEIQPGATARIDVLVRVGPPNQERVFSNSTNLLVNRRGLVPPLVVSATVVE
jgi:hypothetical protein